MGRYLQRYLQGECAAVWDELFALGDQVREEPFRSDAWATTQETMRRVRHNFELAVPRLRALGYVFIHDQSYNREHIPRQELAWIEANPPLHTEPPGNISEQLDIFEREVGTLPLSLRAFYQEVGGFNFVGWYKGDTSKNDLNFIKAQDISVTEGFDPLFVYAFDRNLVEECEEWAYPDARMDDWEPMGTEKNPVLTEECSSIVIAPDAYHKMNVSGSPPYQMSIPEPAADTLLLNEWHNTTFVEYLRICCYYAGLPGLERLGDSSLSEHLDELRIGMLPI